MSYRLLYDNQILFDPYTDDTVTDTSMSLKTNAVAYFDFTIGPQHSLYNVIAERAGKVELYFDGLKLYSGKIIDITTDIECYKSVSCNGVLDYLSDTVVRPYSTVSGEQPLTAPSTVDGFFQWLIDQHNANCLDSDKMFRVGVNQGAMLDENNHIYRASEQRPTTASEIEDKILNSLGGYLFVRYDGDSNILDLYADAHEANTQIIDFGVNITDFSKTETSADLYTVVIATGYTPDPPEGQTDVKMKPITLEGCPDGGTAYSNIIKMGDKVYNIDAVQRYGYREYYVSNTDITTYDGLLDFACRTLNTLTSPQLSIDAKAVDLALYMKNGYDHLQLGQAVRVRSKPHNVDEYLMVNAITLSLQDPGNTEYELGVSYDTLTGQQSAFLKSLNASINSSLDTVSALGDDVKKSAKTAQEAKDTANEANNTATEANSKAENANTVANEAKDTADEAQAKAEEATNKSNEAISASKDASDKAYEAAKKADEVTAKTELIENTLTEISGDTAQAIANAKKAQDAADAAQKAADNAQASADTNATEVGKVKSQVEIINGEISDVKQDAANIRDDLSGQITTVKNTMEADYSRKTELTETTETLRNEISESAAGVLRTVSSDYASKAELKTTTDATNKNAQDLTNAINKFNKDVDSLQGQIDGSIQTWFYEVAPTDKNEPAVNWTTTDLKNVHLGDLYYDTITGYCYRYQVQNRIYSWQRITDVDVTKALADAAKAQDTADHKRRIFVATPTTPYDVGDLWVQGTSGDILRCSVAKTSSQSYAAADWVKASKYTDDSAVSTLSNFVEKTYSTKSEVKQLSDTVSSTVSSVETVRVNAEAAQTSADNAKAAADAAQKSADDAKTNAYTAQSTADAAKKNLETAQKNLETLQKQANATDEQLSTAKANVEKAQKAANDAQTAADTAKTDASTAQATADAAKTAASNAQKDVDSLKSRVTSAETSIKQNSDAIALRATKTEVYGTGVGSNLWPNQYFKSDKPLLGNIVSDVTPPRGGNSVNIPNRDHYSSLGATNVYPGHTYRLTVDAKRYKGSTVMRGGIWYFERTSGTPYDTLVLPTSQTEISDDWYTYVYEFVCTSGKQTASPFLQLNQAASGGDTAYYVSNMILEDITNSKDTLNSAKTYTDAQLEVTSESITSTVSNTYAKSSEVKQTTDGLSLSITKVDDRTSNLETLIRATDSGIEIAKKIDGTYSGAKNRLTNTGMSIIMERNSNDVEVASFGPTEINLGASTTGASINMAQRAVKISTYSAKLIKADLNGAVTSAGSTMTCGRLMANRSLTANVSTCGTSIASIAPSTTYTSDSNFVGSNFIQQTSKTLQYNSIYTLNGTTGGFTKVEQSQNSDGEIVNVIASSSSAISDETSTDERAYLSVSTVGGTPHIDMASKTTSISSDSVFLNTDKLYKASGRHALYGIRTLYNLNSTPATAPTTVTISGVTLNNYDYIEIFGMTSETTQDSVKLKRPVTGYQNAKFSLICYNGSGTNVYLKMTRFTITNSSGNWIFTPSEYNELYHGGGVNIGIGPSITRIDAYL